MSAISHARRLRGRTSCPAGKPCGRSGLHAQRLRSLTAYAARKTCGRFRLRYRIAIGPHAGRKALTLYSVPPLDETPDSPLLAKVAGFSLHAATVCEAWQRNRLEHLCRYITRPPVATKRLSGDGQGRVVYRYKQPFRDGSTHVVLEPLDFMYRMYCMPRAHDCRDAGGRATQEQLPRDAQERPSPVWRL